MIIKVNNIENLNLKDNKTDLYGITSQIYRFGNNYYFKLFNAAKRFDAGYQDLTIPSNLKLYNMIVELSKLENVPLYSKPIYIFKSNNLLYGYVSKKIDGESLIRLGDDTKIAPLFNSVNLLRETVINICKSGIVPNDVYGRNIIYDGKINLIDLDRSYHDEFVSTDDAYVNTMYYILLAIQELLRKDLWNNAYSSQSEDIDIYCGTHLDDYILVKLEREYKTGNLDDFSLYFDRLLELVNNASNCEISTLGELKRNLKIKRN